jgi:hypothetical protein
MGHFFFYLAIVAACLLWSAVFTAAAARTRPGWIRWVILAMAVVVPVLSLVPWVWLTGLLAFGVKLQANWFAPTLTALLSAVIGGAWIVRAGLTPRAAPAAATWPLVGLAAMFVLAKAVAAGTLLLIDNAVAAEGRMLRVEASQIMGTALPPAPAPDDNAAPLYQRAFESLAADKTIREEQSPAADPLTADLAAPEVATILARHAATLDLLRRAADKPGCRFDRDWSRPSIDMLLPQVQEMRWAARLLALATRKAAADGDGAQAIADVIRIHRLGVHVAGEPILVSGLVGQAIDGLVLPRLDKGDLPLLDGESFRDVLETPITYQRAFLGEEAFGLATLGDLADGADGMTALELLRSVSDTPTRFTLDGPFSFLYRCFMLPADITGYRKVMRRYQDVAGKMLASTPRPYPTIVKDTAEIEGEIESRRPGIFAAMLAPTLSGVLKSQVKGKAAHDVAGVLVAATRARLMGKPLADSLVPDAVPVLPGDPFTMDTPLLARRADDAWVVYSVGPDGEDDGGPVPDGAEVAEGNDDVGLRLAL